MCADYFLHMLQGTHFTYNRMGFFTAYYFASIIFNIVVIFYKGPSIYHVDKFSPLFAPPPPAPRGQRCNFGEHPPSPPLCPRGHIL